MRRAPARGANFILHAHAGKGVERAEWFVEQKNLGMIDQGTRQGDPLRHATGKMMRIGIGERFQARPAA